MLVVVDIEIVRRVSTRLPKLDTVMVVLRNIEHGVFDGIGVKGVP